MKVERIEDEHGSHIEPPLDNSWPDVDRLRWKAAVVELDTGIPTLVVRDSLNPGRYSINVGHAGTNLTFNEAWVFFMGVDMGARQLWEERAVGR